MVNCSLCTNSQPYLSYLELKGCRMIKNLIKYLLLLTSLVTQALYAHTPTRSPLSLSSFYLPADTRLALGASYAFTGSSSGHINYIKLCQATDNTCSSCKAPYTVINQGTPISYPQIYSVNPLSYAAYIKNSIQPSDGTGTYYIGMYVQSEETACNSNTSYCSTDRDSGNHFLCVAANATTTGGVVSINSLTQEDNGTVNLNIPTAVNQHAYVIQQANSMILLCMINDTNGNLNTCGSTTTPAGTLWSTPQAIAFANKSLTGNTQYAYITDTAGSVFQCGVNVDGTLTSCAATPTSNPGWISPAGIAFATVGGAQYAYVTDASFLPNVFTCLVGSDGTFSNCQQQTNAPGYSWSQPQFINTATFNAPYAYIYDVSTVKLTQCPLQNDGSFATCSANAEGSSSVSGFSVTTININNGSYNYLFEPQNQAVPTIGVIEWLLESNGSISGSSEVYDGGGIFTAPAGLTFSSYNSTPYAYVTNTDPSSSVLSQCGLTFNPANSQVIFTSCAATPTQNPYSTGTPPFYISLSP